MKIALLGLGRMGRPILYSLTRLGYEVYGSDPSLDTVNKCRQQEKSKGHKYHLTVDGSLDFGPVDAVVSSLPYYLNKKVAARCLDRNVPYFDLGGHLETSKNINEDAKERNGAVFTDLGLAPGLVNILGENLATKGDTLDIYCGGLPVKANVNPLGYSLTWSSEGLLNEYTDMCLIKEKGEIKKVLALTGYRNVDFDGLYESFYTSGAINNLDRLTHLRNVSYRTMRYIGHRDLMWWLMRYLPYSSLKKLIEDACPPTRDRVMIKCVVKNGREHMLKKKYTILPRDGFSAMQVATGYSLSAVVNQALSEGKKGVLTYDMVNVEELRKTMCPLGVNL